ncbi:hypothetical protein [Streptomyces sp. NPDC057438]|uniref:hypothetical protein n=1 Tax=Streptomyces sp. NPDC057438 TaxID=3346133 RepID=UPI00368AC915
MSWLELWEFVLALPSDSMTRSTMAGDRTLRRWTDRDYLMAALIERQQDAIQLLFNIHSEKKITELYPPVNRPDLRTPEQLAEDEARKARQAVAKRRYFEATRPGAPQDTEHARRLAQAREEHLRLMAQAAEESTTE